MCVHANAAYKDMKPAKDICVEHGRFACQQKNMQRLSRNQRTKTNEAKGFNQRKFQTNMSCMKYILRVVWQHRQEGTSKSKVQARKVQRHSMTCCAKIDADTPSSNHQ